MTTETKIVAAVIALLVLAVAAVVLAPSLSEIGRPELVAAWAGIEVEGSGRAVVGPVEIAAGTPFTLHAVLEARRGDGTPHYYTEAPALVVGGEEVAAERVERWASRRAVKVLWATVEGGRRVVEVDPDSAAAEQIGFVEFLRTDWPFTWSLRGRLEPDADDALGTPASRVERPFGTQRYQVAIEIYADESAPLPEERYASWGGSQLPARADDFPTVVAALPGPAGPASSVFGLTQLVPPPEAPPEVTRELVDLTRRHLAFATLPVVRRVLDAAGADPDDLAWRYVDFDGGFAWGDEVHRGDLLRAGERIVVLYADAAPGQADAAEPAPGNGRLDRDDLCFDLVQGAGVRPLGEVFEGEGGQVEWVPLGGA